MFITPFEAATRVAHGGDPGDSSRVAVFTLKADVTALYFEI